MVVRIEVDSADVQKSLQEAPLKLRKLAQKKMRPVTKRLTQQAKQTAPKKSGRISRSIYGRTFSDPVKATIGIPSWVGSSGSGFRYPLFVTGKIPIRIQKENKFFGVGQTVRYGHPAMGPGHKRPIVWDADANWWNRIEQKANKEYPKAMQEAVKEFAETF